MPTYQYECKKCKHVADHVRSISGRDDQLSCPVPNCGADMKRDVIASMSGVSSANEEYDQPVVSHSLGVPVHQLNEARSRFPHHEYQPDGKLVIRSHAERRRVLTDLGYTDLRDS